MNGTPFHCHICSCINENLQQHADHLLLQHGIAPTEVEETNGDGGHMNNDVFGQRGAGPAQPVERDIPPPPPTTIEDFFADALANGENFDRYHRAQVKCTPSGRVWPIELYEQANLSAQVRWNIHWAHYERPAPIQRYTIPCILDTNDVMVCGETGSEKTAAFLLPIFSNLLEFYTEELAEPPAASPSPSPLCLIVSSTRESVLEIGGEARKFAFRTPIVPCSAFGGHDMYAVSDGLHEGCHILSSTIGCLKKMVDEGQISLEKVKFFVLNEVDRMLDAGFESDIRQLETLGLPHRTKRYTSMFSATFPEQVQILAKSFLQDNYILLTVETLDDGNEDIAETGDSGGSASSSSAVFNDTRSFAAGQSQEQGTSLDEKTSAGGASEDKD